MEKWFWEMSIHFLQLTRSKVVILNKNKYLFPYINNYDKNNNRYFKNIAINYQYFMVIYQNLNIYLGQITTKQLASFKLYG